MSRKRKNQQSYAVIVVALIVMIAIIGLITMMIEKKRPSKKRADLAEWFSLAEDGDIGLTVDGITSSKPLKTIDGTVYAPYELVKSLLNDRFYYDKTERLLSVTTPTLCRNFSLDELTAGGQACLMENDAEGGSAGFALSLAFIKEWTDMVVTDSRLGNGAGEDSSGKDGGSSAAETGSVPHITIRRTFPYRTITLTADAQVRTRPAIKAPILYDAAAGERLELVVTDDTAPGWTAVTTQDGLSGYVADEAVGETAEAGSDHVSALGAYTSLSLGQKVNMAFYSTNNEIVNSRMMDKLAAAPGVNVVSPTWFYLEGKGQVTSMCDSSLVEACHTAGIQVWALINDIEGKANDSESTAEVLESTPSRQAIVQTIIEKALAAGVDGLNLDVEHVTKEHVEGYLTFLRELSAACRTNGLIFSVDTTVPMPYSRYLNRQEMGVVCDYVIIMCYDEHFAGSDKAGSVASLSFLKDGIEKAKEMIPAEKVVAGIPFYTRLWTTSDGGAPSSQLMSMAESRAYAESAGMEIFWDEDVSQHVAEKSGDGALLQIWLEDAKSIEAKMAAVRASGIAGVAEWSLGSETPDVWPVISAGLQ